MGHYDSFYEADYERDRERQRLKDEQESYELKNAIVHAVKDMPLDRLRALNIVTKDIDTFCGFLSLINNVIKRK